MAKPPTEAGPLTADQRLMLDALNGAAQIVSDYLEPWQPRHPEATSIA
jgi:hypothetical protein